MLGDPSIIRISANRSDWLNEKSTTQSVTPIMRTVFAYMRIAHIRF